MPDSRKVAGFHLRISVIRRLRYQAVAEDRSMSEIVSAALDAYFADHPLTHTGELHPPSLSKNPDSC